MQYANRLSAVDLRGLPEAEMKALQREAIRRGVPFPYLLGQLAQECAQRIVAKDEELAAIPAAQQPA